MTPDTLSDVLRSVRLTGAVYFNVDAAAPWVAESPPGAALAPKLVRGAEHLISYHVVTEGSCWASLLDGDPVLLETGDVVVFPHGDAHVMSSAPRMRSAPQLGIYYRPHDQQLPFRLTAGEGGPSDTHLVCGFLGCDLRPFNPLIATLPRVLVARERGAASNGWLTHFIRLALAESNRPTMGGECVLARISELMFVEVVRRHVATLSAEETGWLAGLRDEHVGRAIGMLHGQPAHPWSLDELSRKVGLSRTVFAERFSHYVGLPPMQYLARWRMQIAAGLLANGAASVSVVGFEVGYESEAAFSRAFKKLVGISPAAWRKDRGTKGAEAAAG